MSRHDSHIDPFNAGEPELPWEAPDEEPADQVDRALQREGGYESPVKQPDAYDAPDTTEPSGKARAKTRPAKGRPQRPWTDQRTHAAEPRPARNKRGCGCGTVVLILIVINIAFGGIASIPMCTSGALSELIGDGTPVAWDSEFLATDSADPDDPSDDEAAVEEQARALLDTIAAPDSRARALIVDDFSQMFQQALGYTPADFGIDPNGYADWVLADFSYSITDVYAFDDEDGTDGSVFFDALTRDARGFTDAFYMRAFEYLQQQGLTDSAAILPNDQQRSEVQRLFGDTLAEHEQERTEVEVAMLEFTREGDAWQVTDESYTDAARYLFYLY